MPDSEQDKEAASEAQEQEAEKEGPHAEVERIGPCECVIRIEADADYLRSRYQEELESLQSEVSLPGFRRGRAPVGLVEKRMGSAVRSDLISSVVTEAYDEAVEKENLRVVEQVDAPDLENLTWEPGQPVQVAFRCEVMPELELHDGDYKGLKVDVPVLEVTDDLLKEELERFVEQFATWEDASGGADWDDYVEAGVSLIEGPEWKETIGFYPRAERIGPFVAEGIRAALLGAQVGQEVELEAELPEEARGQRKELDPLVGQKVRLKLRLERIMRRKVPALDDEFARKLGMESAGEIESFVRQRLERNLAAERESILRGMLVRALLDRVAFELPPSLVERAATEVRMRSLVRLLSQGVSREEAEERSGSETEDSRDAMVRRLKASYILARIAEKENIYVTESEVDEQVRSFASRQGWRQERARAYMEERGLLRSFREDLRENKTLEFLKQHAEPNELPLDEFRRRYGTERSGSGQDEQGEEERAE